MSLSLPISMSNCHLLVKSFEKKPQCQSITAARTFMTCPAKSFVVFVDNSELHFRPPTCTILPTREL